MSRPKSTPNCRTGEIDTSNLAQDGKDSFAFLGADTLINAIGLLNEVSGTEKLNRPVETELVLHWNGATYRRELYAVEVEDQSLHVDGIAKFHAGVEMIITYVLEPNGTLHVPRRHKFLVDPQAIARELQREGNPWVMFTMVTEAQRRLRGKHG